jgi:creatinine amidohydrolase
VFPIIAERTPACGTLSSPKGASREKGELILRVCTEGISNAVREAFS